MTVIKMKGISVEGGTFIPRFSWGLDSRTPHEKRKHMNYQQSPPYIYVLLFVVFFYLII